MKDDLSFGFNLGAVFTFVGMLSIFIPSCVMNNSDWRHEAVLKGKAEWVLDPVTGGTSWRWKQETKTPEKP